MGKSSRKGSKKCRRKVVKFSFAKGEDPLFQTYEPVPGFVADNAGHVAVQQYKGFARYNVNQFYYTPASGNGLLDHVKTLKFTRPYQIHRKGSLTYNIRMGATVLQPATLPEFLDGRVDDARTGAVVGNLLTDDNQIMDMFFTNTGIYAFYERLPFGITDTNFYSVYSAVHRLGSRKPGQVHDVSLTVDRKRRKLTWRCDDLTVSVDHPGLQPGKLYENGKRYNTQWQNVLIDKPAGPTSIATDTLHPKSAQLGFGCFTLMDFADFDKPQATTGYIKLANPLGYLRPGFFQFVTSLPFPSDQPAPFSLDPDVTTVYGQGALQDIYHGSIVLKR